MTSMRRALEEAFPVIAIMTESVKYCCWRKYTRWKWVKVNERVEVGIVGKEKGKMELARSGTQNAWGVRAP